MTYIIKTMQNSVAGFGSPFPYFYTLFPFQQYSSPKLCQVLQLVNNLEDSTLVQPSTPENAFLFTSNPPTISHLAETTLSNLDSELE